MSTPFDQARALSESQGRDFLAELSAHLTGGFVVSTPALFVMARQDGAALFIWLAVGRLAELLPLLPAGVERVGWCRQGRGWRRDHWVRVERLRLIPPYVLPDAAEVLPAE